MRIPGIPYVQGRNSYTDRDGTKYAIAIHNTSNNAPAAGEAAYATRRTDGVSSHLYADASTVIQSLDLLARAGHAGNQPGNENAIAVEITGVNGWSRQQWIDNVAWAKLGPALAWVCKQFGIAVRRASVGEMQSNPKVKAFYSHDDMRRAWGGTDHTDPGPNFPWDVLFAHVSAALTPRPTPRRRASMSTVYKNLDTGEYALAGDSPGTAANWLPTNDPSVAAGYEAAHGPAVGLFKVSYAEFRANYTAPLRTVGVAAPTGTT